MYGQGILIGRLQVSLSLHLLEEQKLALQLILDRFLRQAIEKEKRLKESGSAAAPDSVTIALDHRAVSR